MTAIPFYLLSKLLISLTAYLFFHLTLVSSDATNVFLGATDLEIEGTFVWDYSRNLLSDTYTDWAPGEPNDHNGREDCIEYAISYKAWNDISNSYSRCYICEQGKLLTLTFLT